LVTSTNFGPKDRFLMIPLVRHRSSWIDISETEFNDLTTARRTLRAAVAIEQNFWLLVENYLDYEKELLNLALQGSVRSRFDWQSGQWDNLEVNRRLANLLSSARLYIDHLSHSFANVAGVDARDEISRQCAAEYDSRLGYRVLEALRNVMQHTSLGVHGLRYPHDRQDNELRIRVVPILDVSRLQETPFKRTVLDELSDVEKHPLTPFVREYLEGLGALHEKARQLGRDPIQMARAVLTKAIEKVRETWVGDQPVQVGRLREGDTDVCDDFHIFPDLLEQWDLLLRQRTLTANTRVFVSGQSDPPPTHDKQS